MGKLEDNEEEGEGEGGTRVSLYVHAELAHTGEGRRTHVCMYYVLSPEVYYELSELKVCQFYAELLLRPAGKVGVPFNWETFPYPAMDRPCMEGCMVWRGVYLQLICN